MLTMSEEEIQDDESLFHIELWRPGTLIDVGAFRGKYTMMFGNMPKSHVVAFEPLPPIYKELEYIIHKNFQGKLSHIHLYNMGLFSKPGVLKISLPYLNGAPIHEWASVTKNFDELRKKYPEIDNIESFDIPISTIDLFGFENVTAIKMDAEGSEYEILKGARKTLFEQRPILSVEIEERHKEGSTWAIPAYLDAINYNGYFKYKQQFFEFKAFDRRIMQVASESPGDTKYSDPYIWIFYFIPREATDLIDKLHKLSIGGIQSAFLL